MHCLEEAKRFVESVEQIDTIYDIKIIISVNGTSSSGAIG